MLYEVITKGKLADAAVAKLGPINAEMKRLRDDPAYVDGILREGAEKAAAIAKPVIDEVYEVVGFLRP